MDIVEHVARAIVQAKGLDPMEPTFASGGTGTAVTVHTRRFNHEISAARAAIRATLHYYMENVSEKMIKAAEPEAHWDYKNEETIFTTMLTQALAELDA